MMDGKRRCSAGYTREACHGCGQVPDGQRKKGTVCASCQQLLAEGKAAKERAALERQQADVGVFTWCEVDYGWPQFYQFDFDTPHKPDVIKPLARAIWELVNLVSRPAEPTTPNHAPTYRMVNYGCQSKQRHHDPWPYVFTVKTQVSDAWSWKTLRVMNPAVRDAIDKVYLATGAALAGVYHHGKHIGGSVLHQLASGETTLEDFDQALMTGEERAARQKARRGY